MTGPEARTRARRPVFALLLLVLLLAALEIFSYAAIALAPASLQTDRAATRLDFFRQGAEILLEQRPDSMAEFHAELGWRPNLELSNHETRINALGLRSEREYPARPAAGVTRIAVFGDSFVYGHEVDLEDAWPSLIEAGAEDIEVLNFGVTGYGPDQAYLRFAAEAEALHPSVVVWAVSPWMMNRIVNVFRPFLTRGNEFAVKPRFRLDESGGLALVPQPITSIAQVQRYVDEPRDIVLLGENDYFYDRAVYENPVHDYLASVRLFTAISTSLWRRHLDPSRVLTGPPGRGVFNDRSEAFLITQALMLRFASDASRLGARAVVMIIPDIHSLRRIRAGTPSIGSALYDRCREVGPVCWNLGDAFAARDAGTPLSHWFMPGGHYSPAGNRIVADWIESEIRKLEEPRGAD